MNDKLHISIVSQLSTEVLVMLELAYLLACLSVCGAKYYSGVYCVAHDECR
jgi:hypothetical protein